MIFMNKNNLDRIARLKNKISRQPDEAHVRTHVSYPFFTKKLQSEGIISSGLENNKENKQSLQHSFEIPSNQETTSINTTVLACIVGGLHCPDNNLWKQESEKILKILNYNKEEINFEELSWYFASKYPRLCKVAEKISDTEMSADTFRVKTSNIVINSGLPLNMEIEKDLEFSDKAQKRHKSYIEFIETKSPYKMTIEELTQITGSMDYLTFRKIDREKHKQFVNAGYNKLIDFVAGDETISKGKIGETYLFFKQVLKELNIGEEQHQIMQNCILPQLSNVASDRPLEYQHGFLEYMQKVNLNRNEFNKKYLTEMQESAKRYEDFKGEMEHHTHVIGKKCYKDAEYYEALGSRILIKYSEEIEKLEHGITSNVGEKAQLVMRHVGEMRQQLDEKSYNSYNNSHIGVNSIGS